MRSGVALTIAGVSIIQFSLYPCFTNVGFACVPVGVLTAVIGVYRTRRMGRLISSVREKAAADSDHADTAD